MKDSKGITLATLVVMIASIIILSTIAISFGYRYINETNKADEKYFKEVLSNAVSKRENNYIVSSNEYPRIGYEITSENAFVEIIEKYIPKLNGIKADLIYESGNWFIIDNKIAKELGVKSSEIYIDAFDENNEEDMTLALVDYVSGSTFIFDISGAEIRNLQSSINGDAIAPENIGEHTHDYNILEATCTEDRKCLICGYIAESALGHEYGSEVAAEPIDEEFHYKKECTRCGMKGGYERHQDLTSYLFEEKDGKWFHYNGCSICGWPNNGKNYAECTITNFKSISDTEHSRICNVCKHDETQGHVFGFVKVDDVYHEEVCTICGFVKTKYEPHEGELNCDKCGCEIIKTQNPILTQIFLKNKEYPDSKYITNGETIQLIFTADKMIKDAEVTICGYGGDNITYTYSADKLTCTAEFYVGPSIALVQNAKVTFSINCKSVTTDAPLDTPMYDTTDSNSYLIYDSIPATAEYISKDSY